MADIVLSDRAATCRLKVRYRLLLNKLFIVGTAFTKVGKETTKK